jgi:chromosome segregation ATPase
MNKKLMKQIKEQVKAQVSSVFSEEDINAQKKILEELLQETQEDIASLSEKIASKEVELVEHVSKIEELTGKVEEMEGVIAQAKEEAEKSSTTISELTEQRDSLQAKLDEVEKMRVVEARLKELDAAKVLRQGDAADKQKAFIMKMDDDSFEEYKSQLIETRKELEEGLKASLVDPNKSKETETPSSNESEEDESETASETTSEEEETVDEKDLAYFYGDVKLTKDTREKFSAFFDTDDGDDE